MLAAEYQELTPIQSQMHEAHKARQAKFTKAGITYQSAEAKRRAKDDEKRRLDEKELQEYRSIKRLEEERPIEAAIQRVAKKYFINPKDITSSSKKHHLILARWEVFHYARMQLKYSFPRIGAEMGKDHSTVLHGVERYQRLLDIKVHGQISLIRKADLAYLAIIKVNSRAVFAGAGAEK